jgi:hypothetical protein
MVRETDAAGVHVADVDPAADRFGDGGRQHQVDVRTLHAALVGAVAANMRQVGQHPSRYILEPIHVGQQIVADVVSGRLDVAPPRP